MVSARTVSHGPSSDISSVDFRVLVADFAIRGKSVRHQSTDSVEVFQLCKTYRFCPIFSVTHSADFVPKLATFISKTVQKQSCLKIHVKIHAIF